MGKGSKPRPVVKPKYDSNWDEINWKSKTLIGSCDMCEAENVPLTRIDQSAGTRIAGLCVCEKCRKG